MIGRLTYTSFDTLDGRPGGWQVKQEQGLDAAGRTRALELVATSLDLVEGLSRFPSSAEVSAAPRRLVLAAGPGGSTVLVHSAVAGPDASGRPGNVFSHVLVVPDLADRLLDDADTPRPLALWRSPDWLVPWGPEAVRDTVLPPGAGLPRPGEVVSQDRVLALLGSPAHADALGAALDAVDRALSGGPPVVLLVDDQESGVLALAAVSALLSPSAVALLTFSTWERAHGVREVRDLPRVSLVPSADAALLDVRDLVVLDLERQQPCTPTGWPCADGRSTVAAGPASAMLAGVATLTPADLLDRLTAVEEIARYNPRAARASHLWPLALAVAEWQLPGAAAAAEVLLAVPLALVDDADARADAERCRADVLGTSPAQAAAALRRLAAVPGTDPAVLDELRGTWLRRSLADAAQLLGTWPPADLPELGGRLDPLLFDVLVEALGPAGGQRTPVERAAGVLRALDLVSRARGAERAWPRLQEPLAGQVVLAARVLFGGDGAEVLAACSPLTPATAALLVPELTARVEGTDAEPGRRLPEHLHRFAGDVLPQAPAALPPALALEVHLLGDPRSATPLERAAAARLLLESPAWAPSPDARSRTRSALERTVGGQPWTAQELLTLQRATASRADVDLQDAVRGVLEQLAPCSPEAVALADGLLAGREGDPALDPLTRCLAFVHRALTPQWYGRGWQAAADAADLVVFGQVWIAAEQVPQPSVDALAPHLLLAAVLVASWSEIPSVPPLGQRQRIQLSQARSELPVLAAHVADTLPLFEDAVRLDPSITTGLFRATVAATFPEVQPRLDLGGLLDTELDPAQVGGGEARLGEVLLERALRTLADHEAWLERQVERLEGITGLTRLRIRAWALPSASPQDADDPVPRPVPRSDPQPGATGASELARRLEAVRSPNPSRRTPWP